MGVASRKAASRIRPMFMTLVVVVTLGATATAARADRLVAYSTPFPGTCTFDNWLSPERNLAATTYYYGTVTRCVTMPVRNQYANAYLSTDIGLGWTLQSRANNICGAEPECLAASSYTSQIDLRAKNEGDGTVDLWPGGTQKNPYAVKFTGVSDPSRCTIYNGGYSVWCRGLYEQVNR